MNAPESSCEPSLDDNNPNILLQQIEQELLQAVTFHQAEQLDDATRLYRDILLRSPLQPNANHNLGVIALERNEIDASLNLFRTALESTPDEPQYWTSYIDALLRAGQIDYAEQVLAHGIEGGLEGVAIESLKRKLADAQLISPVVNSSQESPIVSSSSEVVLVELQSPNDISCKAPSQTTSVKKYGKPSVIEMNALATKFNQGLLVESEPLAIKMTQRYPRHGFGWKVLGALRQQQGMVDEAIHALKMAAELLPNDSEAQYNLGNFFYDQSQLADAVTFYKKAVRVTPKFAEAHYNLGSVLKDQFLFSEAELSYKKALSINPYNATMQLNLANFLYERTRYSEAVNCYEQALKLQPDLVAAYVGLGATLKAIGQPLDAEACYKKALDIDPNHSGVCNNLGILFQETERVAEAEICYRAAIAMKSDSVSAYNNLGLLLKSMGKISEAEANYRSALELDVNNSEALNNLGLLLQDQLMLDDAMALFRRLLSIKPNYPEANCNLAMVFNQQSRFSEAERYLHIAIQEKPDFADAHNNLGIVLWRQGRMADSEKSFLRALQIKPRYVEALNNLSGTYRDQGRATEAVACFRKVLEIKPGYHSAFSNMLFSLTHNAELSAQDLFAEHCRFGEQYEAPLKPLWTQHANSKELERCLRIGFVSGDFRNHAVANFIEPVLENLASYSTLSLYAYSTSIVYDEVSDRLQKHFKQWEQVAILSPSDLAEKIRADGIDILIDLSGHTADNRLLSFAYKPAPIQASWIGYPGTTGLTAIDYYLADRFLLPPGKLDDQFTEKLVQLPASVPFLPSPASPPVNRLPALSNGFVTFASFNRPSKISREVVALWALVLHALPNARMLLGSMHQDGNNEAILKWFAQEGIALERLILHPRSDIISYLSLHQQVDICLDAFPYNGGTTTWHAIWMGVPTLTLTGDMMQSRVGAWALCQLGIDGFDVSRKDEFVQQAVFWAENLDVLAEVRANMRTRFAKSPIGRPDVIAQGLESALRTMWKRWCNNLPAESFEITEQEQEQQQLTELPVKNEHIYVTQPLLPPLEDFIPYLQKIWDSKILTNGGLFHQQLEQALCDYLGVKHIALFANGTLALLTALQALRITGEVITTPYSFVATAHSLLWNGIKPVFVDIDPVSLNMDPAKIEAAITPLTTAIMPVHCYGHPCDVDRIQKIADNYNLKIIYDAAHAFGVQYNGGSVLNYGDLSVLSFHATKVFNTFEGGAIICPDAKTKHRIDQLKNFGFVDELTVVASGINGKMSEVNAAFGLLQLKGIDEALRKRKDVDQYYRDVFSGVSGIYCVPDAGEDIANYSYFPILVQQDYPMSRDDLYQKLRDAGIFARRYFYPLISDFPMYRGMPSAAQENLPVAKKIAEQVICLPIYPDLAKEQIDFILGLIVNKAVR